MISIMKQGNIITTYVNEYVLDTDADVKNLPRSGAPGSVAIVTSTSNVYMLDSSGDWKML